MEEALAFFLQQARRAADKLPKKATTVVATELVENAVAMYERVSTAAQGLAPYKHPRLTAMKVGQDRDSPFLVPDGVTAAQLKAELMEMMVETGLAPDMKLLEPPIEGIANREENASE